MEIKYLKMLMYGGDVHTMVKIMPNQVIDVINGGITVLDDTEDVNSEYDWYKSQCQFIDATKEEFDNFFIQQVALINKASKL